MQIWTGKFCLRSSALTIVVLAFCLMSCSSSDKEEKNSPAKEVDGFYKASEDQQALEELRKDIPPEIRESNDRLAESLKRWKIVKTPPDVLRSKFSDEIAKMRRENDKRWKRMRQDFQNSQKDKRTAFLAKQKEEREKFFKSKPVQAKRQEFMNRQGVERDRFFADQRDERSDFDEKLKDERKIFSDEVTARWAEFRQEYPEYVHNYKEMKKQEEEKRAATKGKPYQGWPYKDSEKESSSGKKDPHQYNVNDGGEGWPKTDPSEFESMPSKGNGP